jgi:hypothetical protein
MTEPIILYSKECFTLIKNDKNKYSLSFYIENNNILLSKILDFNLIKLIYDLNPDIYEKVNIQILNENEAIVNLLMKHLFEDLGLPQRFSYLNIKKTNNNDTILFTTESIKHERPTDMPQDAELMNINSSIKCDIITPHKINIECNLTFEKTIIIPAVVEKLIGLILYKVFNRVKQFIENVILYNIND